MDKVCSVEGCGILLHCRKLCKKHYIRLIRHGDYNYTKRILGENRINNDIYHIHEAMLQRCNCKTNVRYMSYGGRGITIGDRRLGVHGFTNFCEDMGKRPEGFSLDRIDNNGNYCKENCRRASIHQQSCNKRNNNKTVGVFYDKHNKRRVANLELGGKVVMRKGFKNYNDAVEARKNAEVLYNIVI